MCHSISKHGDLYLTDRFLAEYRIKERNTVGPVIVLRLRVAHIFEADPIDHSLWVTSLIIKHFKLTQYTQGLQLGRNVLSVLDTITVGVVV